MQSGLWVRDLEMYFKPWPADNLIDKPAPVVGARFTTYVCFTPSGFLSASTDLAALYQWRNAYLNKGNDTLPIEIATMDEYLVHVLEQGFEKGYTAAIAACLSEEIAEIEELLDE